MVKPSTTDVIITASELACLDGAVANIQNHITSLTSRVTVAEYSLLNLESDSTGNNFKGSIPALSFVNTSMAQNGRLQFK